MDYELEVALEIFRRRLSENKMAAVNAIVRAELYGDDPKRNYIELGGAKIWLTREIDVANQRLQEGS